MNLIQLTFYNAEFLVNWLGADFHFIIWHCSTENFPNPRQKTFLLKCKIFLFRSRSDRKYLAWKIHQWPYYSDLGFHICCAHISNSSKIQSLCFEGKTFKIGFSLKGFVWCEYCEHVCKDWEMFFGEENTIESGFETEGGFHSNLKLDYAY